MIHSKAIPENSWLRAYFVRNYTPKTHYEDGKFFGRILLTNGWDYYLGPFNSRNTARRAVLRTLK